MKPITTVLVVDDSRTQREHVAELCQALGVPRVMLAEDGADALAQLAGPTHMPDAMIIDLEMPVMDGVQLIEQLRQRSIDVPFAVASQRDVALREAVELMARVQGLRVVRGLRKPVTEDDLRDALRRCAEVGLRRPSAALARAAPPISAEQLRAAIAEGSIVPHYQPKVDGRSGVIRGVEVLARWPDPTLDNPPPERFIAAAESLGLIHALTMSILRQSFAQAELWNARGLHLTLAVNLSPRLLECPNLVDEIVGLAAGHHLAPEQVVLEITETSVLAPHGAALGTLARLRMKGFGLSIDDYGSGFSSMQQLARVPFTELKIDRSLVDGAHRSEQQRTILQSAVEMGARLSLTCVAEGVESMEDWRLLQDYGCTVGQGWLFGKAMPAAELPEWLKRHSLRLPELRSAKGHS